ncbi:site-2 protease family protein [Rickettsia sp. R2]|uniref:site-2 protease family protein n=1 Tax=Rickettsia koreansis TaxID=2358204 RepID=UPI00397AA991
MNILNFFVYVAIFVFSLVIHEIAHAHTAYYLGDPTAKNMGRFSPNPLKHISLIGILLPIGLYLTGMPMFGFAKPVLYNPVYFKKPKRDMILVGLAGPLSNFLLAALIFLILRIFQVYSITYFNNILGYILVVNLVLCFFNLIPIPPLDGSILYMSSIIHKNQEFAQKLTWFCSGILLYIIVFLPLTGDNIIARYMQWCINALLSLFH